MSEIYQNPEEVIFTTPLPSKKILKSIPRSVTVLDLGCGYGRTLRYLYELGYKNLTGVDSSQELIKKAKKEVPGAKYYFTDILKYKPEKKYGLIIIGGVIEYFVNMKDRQDLVSLLSSLTKKNSFIYLATFIRDKNYYGKYRKMRKLGKMWGTLVTDNGVKIFHASAVEIDRLFQKNFRKRLSFKRPFKTWSGKTTSGYVCLFERT